MRETKIALMKQPLYYNNCHLYETIADLHSGAELFGCFSEERTADACGLMLYEYTACFHILWKTTRISGSYSKLTRDTASQLQRFLSPNKGPGIFLRMRQEAVIKISLVLSLWYLCS
jgi:hypothetical protein